MLKKTIIVCLLFVSSLQLFAQDTRHDAVQSVRERYPDGVGRWWELFLNDDHLVESTRNIEIVSAQALKIVSEPVVKQDKPWELDRIGYTNVIYDAEEKLYKMWYHIKTAFFPYEPAGGVPGEELSMCYAISRDGIHWEKPELNVIQHDGQRTNIVFSGITGMKAGAYFVLKDYSEPDPGKRYKVLFNFWDFQGRGLGVGWSPDGIHWQAPHPYTLIQGGFDTHNIAFWDKKYGCWVAYTRRWQYGKRHISRATSPDLFHWSQDVTVEGPDERDDPDEDLYTPACFQLKEARNVYIMVTGVSNIEENIVTPQLAVSRDGMDWHRFRKPFIRRGKPGEWDSGGGYPMAAEIPSGEDMLFYYIGSKVAHGKDPGAGIGIASIKRDRYVGLKAGKDEGLITTQLLALTHHGGKMPDRGVLCVNANAKDGYFKVEILDHNGHPIPGYAAEDCIPLSGDKLEQRVRWQDHRNLYPVLGKPVRLRFYLKNATIYGFHVERHDRN
ncbi:hypothetical protein GF406_10000 [candidate division KSB1 bacterium]|nr:hypothetical protein [candidate division KSB1 bacterium]